MADSNISDRSRGIALALATVIGPFGGHRFYVGKIGTGLLQLATLGGLGVWWLYDWILVLAGGFRDVDGRRVANWGEDEGRRAGRGMDQERLEVLLDELDRLRMEVGELDERMDFMERMLASARDRGAIPPGPGSV